MSSNPLTLRRETLAKFLPSLEAIVAFENLFQQVNETAPVVSEEIDATIATLYSRLASQQSDLRADIDLIKNYLGI